MKNPFVMFALGVLLGVGAAYGLGALKGGDGKDAPESGGEWQAKHEEAEREAKAAMARQ